MPKNNIFIVIDGIDGSGKSEIVKMLHNYLFSKNKKYRILTTREPTNGTYGSRLREVLKSDKNPKSGSKMLMDLFIKDRREHLDKVILPFLNNSSNEEVHIAICDRYYYSTIAFQGGQGIDVQEIIRKNGDFRKPDIAFILDLAPQVALERIKLRKKEKFEELGFMERIRENFLRLPEILGDNMRIIDSSGKFNVVFENIRKEVDKILKEI